MKRFFAWITALLMLLSLAACSSTQTNTAAASQQASTSETGKSEKTTEQTDFHPVLLSIQ